MSARESNLVYFSPISETIWGQFGLAALRFFPSPSLISLTENLHPWTCNLDICRSFILSCLRKRFALHAATTTVLYRIRKYIPAFVSVADGSLRRGPFLLCTGCLPAYAHALLGFAGMYATCMVPSRGTFRTLTWDEHRAAPAGWGAFSVRLGDK